MSRVPRIRSRRQWRYALRSAATAALAVLIATSGLSVWPGQQAAFAAEDEPAVLPQPMLVVAPADPLVESDAPNFRFEVLLKNPSDAPIEAGTVVLTIDNQRAETAEDLQFSNDRASLEITRIDVVETAAGEDQLLEISVLRDDFPMLFTRTSGVYPVHARFVAPPAEGEVTSGEAGASAEAETNADAGAGAETDADADASPGADGEVGVDVTREPDSSDLTEAPPLTASTALIWDGIDSVSPLPLTFVVPIVLPSSVQTLPSSDELAQHSSQLLGVFDAAEQRNATIAIDPRIIAAIRALGTSAPGGAIELLDRIERSTTPIFLLQFADADPAVQAALGLDELLQPLGFTHATQLGTFEVPPLVEAPAESDTAAENGAANGGAESTPAESTPAERTAAAADPAATGNAGAEGDAETNADADAAADAKAAVRAEVPLVDPYTGVPTLAGLLTLEHSRPGAWPAGGEVDSATLSLLQQAGLTSIVLDSTNVSKVTSPRVTVSGFDALIADAALGAAAHTAMAGETPTDQLAGAATLTARLALSAQSGAAGAVLALDRGALVDNADPLRIFQIIDGIDWVHPLSERQQPAGTAELRAGASTEERRELLRATMLRSEQIDELSPLLERPQYLLEYQRERVLESLATRYAEPGVDFAAVDSLTKQRDDELLQGVHPIVTESTQLVGTLSNVPVTLGNALPFEAVVDLRVNPTSAGIAVPTRKFEVRVPANGSAAMLVPVHSRISSGESGLALEVLDRSGQQSFTSAWLPLTLRTTIETILMWVLGSAAALLLGFGILRSIRRRRGGSTDSHDQVDPVGSVAQGDTASNASTQ